MRINIIILLLLLTACGDRTSRNQQIIKPVTEKDSNTINWQGDSNSYPFPKTNEGYEKAGRELKNPLPQTGENMDKGKELFNDHCAHCHGLKGKSDALMISKDKFPPPPLYSIRLKTVNEGKMFHSITLGKNFMPSFRNELTPEERWELIMYIQTLMK